MNTARRRPAAGESIPHFALRNQHGETVTSEELHGSPSVLMFYPFAFSRVCSAELSAVRDRWSEFAEQSVRLCAISCDSVYTLRAYADELGDVACDLLSDFWPHGAVSASYGAFDDKKGCPKRETFIVDRHLNLHRTVSAGHGEARELSEVLEALGQLRTI